MPSIANPADDERMLADHASRLADGIDTALGPWVEAVIRDRTEQWQPGSWPALADAAAQAGRQAASEVGARVRGLLELDVDAQRTGPLAVLREAVRYPTGVLRDAGVPEVVRDEFAEQIFPDDAYDLAIASFADLDPALHEPGLVWGAAKAHVVLARRRASGQR